MHPHNDDPVDELLRHDDDDGDSKIFPLPNLLAFCGYAFILMVDKVMFDSHALIHGHDHGHGEHEHDHKHGHRHEHKKDAHNHHKESSHDHDHDHSHSEKKKTISNEGCYY